MKSLKCKRTIKESFIEYETSQGPEEKYIYSFCEECGKYDTLPSTNRFRICLKTFYKLDVFEDFYDKYVFQNNNDFENNSEQNINLSKRNPDARM